MNGAKEPVLEVRNLTIHYSTSEGAVQAVRDCSFTLRKGESIGLLGESGCGKTTIALALLGVLPSNATIVNGSITLQGQELTAMSEEQLKSVRWSGISMIFQAAMNSFSPVHRVGEQIAEAIQAHESLPYRETMERVKQLYELVGIDAGLLQRYPHEYSGGMKQRAVIAMALACNPSVVVADEPTTALDAIVQSQILERLNELQSINQTAFFFISHDVGVIAQMSDYVGVMYAGEIVEYGKCNAVLTDAQHPYTRALSDSFLSITGAKRRLLPLGGSPPDLAALPEGCAFYPRCGNRTAECSTQQPPRGVDGDHWQLCWNPITNKNASFARTRK